MMMCAVKWAVYPRLRGGSFRLSAISVALAGLSPPTRGILVSGFPYRALEGSIPAYAGDPAGSPPCRIYGKVYPRLRGGSGIGAASPARYGGLSPPTRGIHAALARVGQYLGSIPAYAGDPRKRTRGTSTAEVYPRLRGGSAINIPSIAVASGLSPPTRGIREHIRQGRIRAGSIPAYAGDPRIAYHAP